MKKILIDAPLEYVAGHLRYGHLEGVIEVPDEEFEKFKENPIDFLYDNEYIDELDLLIDDWEILMIVVQLIVLIGKNALN